MGSGGIAPRILSLRTSRRWVVSFTSRPLYSRVKYHRYLLDWVVGGEEKIPCLCRESNPGRPLRSLVTKLTKDPAQADFIMWNHGSYSIRIECCCIWWPLAAAVVFPGTTGVRYCRQDTARVTLMNIGLGLPTYITKQPFAWCSRIFCEYFLRLIRVIETPGSPP
jgi:hypothetical protein